MNITGKRRTSQKWTERPTYWHGNHQTSEMGTKHIWLKGIWHGLKHLNGKDPLTTCHREEVEDHLHTHGCTEERHGTKLHREMVQNTTTEPKSIQKNSKKDRSGQCHLNITTKSFVEDIIHTSFAQKNTSTAPPYVIFHVAGVIGKVNLLYSIKY